MMPMFAREFLQPPGSHSVEDVAVKKPFEEAEKQVNGHKYRDECECSGGKLSRPEIWKKRANSHAKKRKLEQHKY